MSIRLYLGDARSVLAGLPEGSVHVACTSPPYWGLRNYGGDPVVWGGDTTCNHEWGFHEVRADTRGKQEGSLEGTRSHDHQRVNAAHNTCMRCDAWLGCLGLEPTPDAYITHLCEITDAGLRRVLRKDGLLWLNLGDCYCGGGRAGKNPEYMERHTEFGKAGRGAGAYGQPVKTPEGMKSKDLVGIPWMVAFEMRRRGWYLRGAIPWVKRSGMPSSVTDRPTTMVEYVFLFAHPDSGGRYFYDVNAVRIPPVMKPQRRTKGHAKRVPASFGKLAPGQPPQRFSTSEAREEPAVDCPPGGRQLRDADFFFDSLRAILDDSAQELLHTDSGEPVAFTANPGGGARWEFCDACSTYYEGSECTALKKNDRKCLKCGSSDAWVQHFAMFPTSLVSPMIQVSTSERGVCPGCGAPWVRVIGDPIPVEGRSSGNIRRKLAGEAHNDRVNTHMGSSIPWSPTATPTEGWAPSCSCPAADPVPATVLDPFGGAGTTLLVAQELGRSGDYIDAQPGYLRATHARLLRRKNAAGEKR